MSARVNDDEAPAEGARGIRGRVERDGILPAVDDEGRRAHRGEPRNEIEVAETLPHRLLDPPGDAEGSEVARGDGVGEVAGDADLEQPLAIRLRVALAEPRRGELGAHRLHLGALLTSGELLLELLAVPPGEGRRVEEDEPSGGAELTTARSLERMEQREEPAPRVAHNGQRVDVELLDDGGEIVDVRPPGYGRAVLRLRAAASALVVEEELVPVGEPQHLRQHVVVVCSGASMQHEQSRRASRAVRAPRSEEHTSELSHLVISY